MGLVGECGHLTRVACLGPLVSPVVRRSLVPADALRLLHSDPHYNLAATTQA